MAKPGLIYHKDTRGNEGLYTIEEMVQKNITPTPYTHTIHYASAVFEGIRAVWDEGREKLYLITIEQHLQRFINSMRSKFLIEPRQLELYGSMWDYANEEFDDEHFGAKKPKKEDLVFLETDTYKIKKAIIKTVQENIKAGNIDPKKGCYIRPIAYRDQVWNAKGEFDPSLGVFSLKHSVTLEIEAFTWGAYLTGSPKVLVYPEGEDTPLRRIKSGGNYAFGGEAKDYSMLRGYSEAIITDSSPQRNVLEGGGENLFAYLGDVILTADRSQSILPGTKRNLVIEISKNLGYNVLETKIPLDLFFEARSAAFSGTAAGYEGIDRVKDAKTGRKKIFDLNYEPLVTTVKEYKNLISGKEVNEKNKGLQEKIRTEVPL